MIKLSTCPRETTLAKVADTFRESIIDRFDHYTEIIIRVHEHAGAKNDNTMEPLLKDSPY